MDLYRLQALCYLLGMGLAFEQKVVPDGTAFGSSYGKGAHMSWSCAIIEGHPKALANAEYCC